MYLLDTQTFLWSVMMSRRINASAREILEDKEAAVFVSVLSFWEISSKHRLGKLNLHGAEPREMPSLARALDFRIEPLSDEDAATYAKLPLRGHKDPFDRMLVWQTVRRKWKLISSDRSLHEYEPDGLKVIWSGWGA